MQFKLSALLALVAFGASILAVPVAEAEADAAPVANWKQRGPAPLAESALEERDTDGNLMARACSYTTGCRSVSGAKSGRYCGYCLQVSALHTWVGTHVYQLNGATSASGCCDYGYSSTCAAQYNSTGVSLTAHSRGGIERFPSGKRRGQTYARSDVVVA